MKSLLSLFLCLTILCGYSQNTARDDKIPFELTPFNNIKVKVILNKKDTVFLTFDSGATDFYLTKEAIKKYLNPKGLKLTMDDIRDNTFTIGHLEWTHQQIYPIETTGQGTEGLFGWNIFEGKILEIDYDKKQMLVHNKVPKIDRHYEKFGMEIMKEHFLINLEIIQDKQKYKSKFLFDTGFQKALMLDNDLLTKMNFPTDQLEILKTTILHNSNNDEIPLKTVKVQKILFGKYALENTPAEVNTYNKPAGYETNFVGSDVLKRFHIILDFQKKAVYMKPNLNFTNKYFDEKI